MKSIFPIIFLSIFFLKMGGYYAILSVERELIRENVEEKIIQTIPHTELTCIIANQENLPKITWERAEKEFEFEGNLYDVVSVEIKNGITHYYCLSDKAETRLASNIEQWLDSQTDHLPFNGNTKLMLHLLLEPLTEYFKPSFQFSYFLPIKELSFPQFIVPNASDFVSKLKRPPQSL